jgi:2-polyprenyl-3-methyl-5-hydroxy-6-metoxy-1,4-benzoquinol methylase
MNYKLLFPTYRTRERWVHSVLSSLSRGRMLNVGAGEGDIDAALASYATELESCDINEDDVARARALNAGVPNLRYSVQDSEALTFADASFDVVTSLEVIEHVSRPKAMLAEIARVLRPGGTLVLSCPSVHFPITYDPVNAWIAPRHVPLGAYAYGHDWLVDGSELEHWLAETGFMVASRDRLSGWLVGALECYWPGLLQRALKANAGNTRGESRRGAVRPSAKPPPLLGVVDALIALDRKVAANSPRAIGLGYVARTVVRTSKAA